MSIIGPLKNLFFNRVARLNGEVPDYYIHEINEGQRFSVVRLIQEYSISYSGYGSPYDELDEWRYTFERELGKSIGYRKSDFLEYLKKCDLSEFLSAIELLILVKLNHASVNPDEISDLKDLIEKINRIFNIHKIGFEIVLVGDDELPFMIIPFESKFQLNETVLKPRTLLFNNNFNGALDEFDRALDNYRLEKYSECIHIANKAYESTLKTILDKKGIGYTKNDTIPKLVTLIIERTDLLKVSTQEIFIDLDKCLKNGPNVIRNLAGIGHGQGEKIKKVEQSYAKFVINMVGSIIVFLIERYEES
ncbi:abortive infection family protein [uncultured Methanospirillum sp.]|uniref:abortive infection family protein n=1 Tax=uncultured Methanospirillum sp. TaxID=262503 RepID=UPI0029C83473|nr:abortive infection family protein [uncultured Methanospirillum sp.]